MTLNHQHLSADSDRRSFLKKLSLAVGATTAAALATESRMAQAFYFHQPDGAGKRNHALFNDLQKAVLFELCDAVLPRTDTASATEVDCHRFIEHQLVHCHSKQEQDNCVDILNQIEARAQKENKQSFTLLSKEKQQQLLTQLEQQNGFSSEQKAQFTFLKVLLVFGYFTSEVGASQALNYQAVPGGFKGSIPYTKNSKAWGSKDLY